MLSAHIETYPYYIEFMDISGLLQFNFYSANIIDKTFYKIDNQHYDISYNFIINDRILNKNFLITYKKKELYYGINFINDAYINNIYTSFHGLHNNVSLDLMSYFYMGNNVFYKYNTHIKFKYKSIFLKSILKQDNKIFHIGFENNNVFTGLGINTQNTISHFIMYKYKKFSMIFDNNYNWLSNDIEKDYFIMYEYQNFRFTSIPIIYLKGDTLKGAIGLLFRHFSFLSYFVNFYNVRNINDFYSSISNNAGAGIKLINKNLMFNIYCDYDFNNNLKYSLSFLLRYKYFNFGIVSDYNDSLEYKINIKTGKSFFDDNMMLNIECFVSQNIGTYLNIKLIDAYIFAGIDWFIKEELYNIKWGAQWYFSEKL